MARSFRITYRAFTTLVTVGVAMLALAAFLVLGNGQAELRDSYGDHLTQIAERTAAAIDSYVFRRVLGLSVLARVPDVRAEAAAGNQRPLDAKAVMEIDREWQQKHAVPTAVAGLLNTPASRFLADVTVEDGIYREIMVTDRNGRLVAASGVTSDYYQADEPWWKEAFGSGVKGRAVIGDVAWDDSSRTWAIEITVPIDDPSGKEMAGLLKAVVDVREMVAMVSAVRLGQTGEATLLRDDGSLVLSRRMDPTATFFAPDLLREHLKALSRGEPGVRSYIRARPADNVTRLVAFSAPQLRASYPHLTWLVAVSQSEDELFRPVRAQMWSLLAVLAITAAVVAALALWFSLRLTAPLPDEELHLIPHAKVTTIDETEPMA